jgi:hypothetical protein
MRDPSGRNAAHASELLAIGQSGGGDLHVTELDVQSQEPAGQAIKTIIIMPGAFTRGTEHFPNASHASDQAVAAAYAALDPMVARNEEATTGLIAPESTPTRPRSPRRSPASSRFPPGPSPRAASSTTRCLAQSTT